MEKIKLEDLCNPSQGQIKEQPDTVIDYIDISSVDNERKMVSGYQTMTFAESPSRARKIVKKGNILVSTVRPNLNAVAVLEEETPHVTVASTGFCILDCKDGVDKRFVFNFCRSKAFIESMVSQATGASYPAVSDKIVRSALVPLYTSDEQRRIGMILDAISAIIEKRRQELTRMDELIKVRFVEMFGDLADPACKWEKCRLVDACANSDDIKCGPFGTQLGKDEYTEEGVSVWEIPQINSEFKTLPTHFVTEEKAAALNAYSIIPGDIAMSRKGNVGRCAVFPATFENGIIHSDVLRIRLDETKAFPEFMMRQLHYSGDIQHQIELVSSGAIMAGINVTKLKHIFVYLPPIELQGEFVAFVAQVDKSKVAVQAALREAQLLYDNLMQQFFG